MSWDTTISACGGSGRRRSSTGVNSCLLEGVFSFARRSLRGDNMKLRKISSVKYFVATVAAVLLIVAQGVPGPPLICHAADIGTANSLPCTSSVSNLSGQKTYDVSHFLPNTLA